MAGGHRAGGKKCLSSSLLSLLQMTDLTQICQNKLSQNNLSIF